MWSDEEMKKKENIENSARKLFDLKLKKWWEQQQDEKYKNRNYEIQPFFVWEKNNKC